LTIPTRVRGWSAGPLWSSGGRERRAEHGLYSIREEERMPELTYKLIELVGVPENTMEEAIRNALARASQTLNGGAGTPPRRGG
jgi:Dodecin